MERQNMINDELAEQLSEILDADDATLEMMLSSGHIDAITDSLYTERAKREQLAQFRADGMSADDIKEHIAGYEEGIDDLLTMLADTEGKESPRYRVIEGLLNPGLTFLYQVYKKYLEGDCLLKVELLEGAQLPTRAHESDAGMDVYSAVDGTLEVGEIYAIGTGLKVAIPVGWQLSVRPRSGLSMKGLTIVNSPGTIDANYHDEIKILLKNNGTQPYTVMKGDRIAQFVLEKIYTAKWETVDNLKEHINESRANEEGEQGFGSTGR